MKKENLKIKKGECFDGLAYQEKDEEEHGGFQINKSFDAKMQEFDKWDFRMMELGNFHFQPPDALSPMALPNCSGFF